MSQHQMLRNSLRQLDEQGNGQSILALCEAQIIDQIKVEEKMKQIHSPIEFPTCGSYSDPDLRPIRQKKIELGEKFIQQSEKSENNQTTSYDGLFQYGTDSLKNVDMITRQKTRFVADLRSQYWEQNGSFIIEKQLFPNQLSKLANISFQFNECLHTYQKNAIISERNNQKKQIPFQLQLYVAGLFINHHPLHNQQQKKFEQLRILLKQWASVSLNPSIPQIVKELKFLQRVRQDGQNLQEVQKKINLVNKRYNEQKASLEDLAKNIVARNEELKDIRKRTGMETVPWKIHIKQFTTDGRPSYDIGVTPFEVSQKVVANNLLEVSKEEARRQQIKMEKYFIRIYANNYMVGQSQKVKIQWPSYKVNFQQKFNILLYTAPATIKVQIIKAGFINSIIDTVYLSVPGLNAKSITSSEKRYYSTPFFSNGTDIRKQIKQGKKEDRSQPAAPAGVLLQRMQWKGESRKMPMIGTKTLQQETACTVQTQTQDQSAYEQLFDPLDPRIDHKQLKEKIDDEIKRSGDALLPFVDIQSARHLLLKMKHSRPELQKIQIPLTEEEIRNRQDLQQIIQDQYNRVVFNKETQKNCFHPLEGRFSEQPPIILNQIKEILDKVNNLKSISGGSGGNTRYKITQQIINEYIFEQMESPIVIFFRNLFTQKRKLGPSSKVSIQAKTKIDQLQISLHIRSAKNVPIRQASFERIKKFQDEQNQFKNQQMMMQYQNNPGLMDRFGGYGQGYFRQQPHINMHGNTFFNAFQNQGRPNQQVSYDSHLDLDRVSSLIMMKYKKNIKRTRCFEGPFPEWNQTLLFNYSMKQQETNLEKILTSCENSIKIFLFDMLEESKPTQAISQARVKKTKFYLGRIEVPLSFLVAVPSVSGLFKIDRPLIEFGYGIRRSGLFDSDNQQEQQNKTQNPDIHTYVNLDLFTEPLIDSLIAYNSDRKFVVGAGQNPLVLQRANDWLQSLNTKRYVRLWLNNLDGKSIFICRFLSDQISPPKLSSQGGSGSLIQRAARFVSLIPLKFNCKLFEGTEQFHLKCDELLSVKIGEDHGILLCNYFNYIDKMQNRRDYESLLIICKAFPYGKSIFVLRRDKTNNNCEVWDPYRGQCYYVPAKQYETFCCFIRYEKQQEANDKPKDSCPIIEISCLVSRDNVYFNLQEETKVSSIDFNITDQKLWKSFLNERTRNDLFEKGEIQTIQPSIGQQFYPEPHKLQSNLQVELVKYIRQVLEKQRRNHFKPYTFKMNDRITNIVYNKLMPLCEPFKVDNRVTGAESKLYNDRSRSTFEQCVAKIQEERDKIKTELPHEKNLVGFTMNTTFTTKEQVLQKIRETQLHLDENDDIEFVLTVRCFQYPCMLISVWMFIGIIS